MDEKIKVLLIEDDPDFCYLIRQVVQKCDALTFVGAVGRGDEGVTLARMLRPHVVLVDLGLPGGMDGVEAARIIRLTTDARVLILTSREDQETIIKASKQAFASGYVFKSQCQTLSDVICRTGDGPTPQAALIRELTLSTLSPAERSVVEMSLGGDAALRSAGKTIANQKTSIFRKLGIRNTAELVHIFGNW